MASNTEETFVPVEIGRASTSQSLRDGPPQSAAIEDKQLREIAKAIGNNEKVFDLGLKLDFLAAEVRNYRQMNYAGGEVTSNGTTNMLFDWREKSADQQRDLYNALKAEGLLQIAEVYLLKDLTPTEDVPSKNQSDPFVQEFREELKDYYLDDYCYVTTDPWEEKELKLDRYFINMALCQEEEWTGKVRKVPLERGHNDLFDLNVDERKRKRILVFGEGGMGKSTLCKKLAYDWAKEEEHSPLKNVPILCVLEFRKLLRSDNVADAIHRQLLCKDSKITPERISQFIRANPSQIVLVLDGFDEFDPESSTGDFNDLLSCKIMAKVTTLVTTRPWHTCLLRKKKQMYAQVSLDGFDVSGIEAYVYQYFADAQTANKCLASIKANGIMLQLAKTPILLSMICFLKQTCSEDIDQIDTLNSLFAKFLRALFLNNMDKVSVSRRPLYHEMSLDTVDMKKIEDFWDDLGKLALEGVLIPGKKLMFSRDDFHGKEDLGKIGLKIGILVRHKLKMTQDNVFESMKFVYAFPHLLFQEKCAGDYLASHSDVMDSTLNSVSDVGTILSLQYSLAFSCGRSAREENHANRVRSKKIIHRLSEMQDKSGGVQSFVTETTGLDNQVPDFLDDMLAVKTHHFARALFLLGIMINHESQAEDALLQEINELDKDRPVHSGTQDYDGRLCQSLLYYLQFACKKNLLLQPCSDLNLTNSIDNISLFDLLSVATEAFDDLKRVSLYKFSGDFSLPVGQYDPDCGKGASKLPKITELSLSHSLDPVDFFDLLKLTGYFSFHLMALSVIHCQLSTISQCSAIKGTGGIIYPNESLEKIEMNSIETTLPMGDLLKTVAQLSPNLKDLQMNFMTLDILKPIRSPHSDAYEKTSVNSLTIGFIENTVFALDLLNLVAVSCPQIKTCHLNDMALEIPTHSDLHNISVNEKMKLTDLSLEKIILSFDLTDLMNLIGKTTSHVKVLSLNNLDMSISNLPNVGIVETTNLEDMRLRKVRNISPNPHTKVTSPTDGKSANPSGLYGMVGVSRTKMGSQHFSGDESEMMLGQKDTDVEISCSRHEQIPSPICAHTEPLLLDNDKSEPRKSPSAKSDTNRVTLDHKSNDETSACTPYLAASASQEGATTSHGENVVASPKQGVTALGSKPEATSLPTTDIVVQMIPLSKRTPTDFFSLLDLVHVAAISSPNLKKLRLLDMTIDIPPYLGSEASSFNMLKSQIQQMIIAGSRFLECSLAHLLCHVAMLCPQLQLLGLSDWVEDIGLSLPPCLDFKHLAVLRNENLTEVRIDFRNNAVLLPGLLSLTSSMCPNLSVLSIARVRLYTAIPTQLQKRFTGGLSGSDEGITLPADRVRSKFRLGLIRCLNAICLANVLHVSKTYYPDSILDIALSHCQVDTTSEQTQLAWDRHRHCRVQLTHCRPRLQTLSIKESVISTCPFLELVANEDEYDPTLQFQTRNFESELVPPFFDDARRVYHYALLQREIDLASPNSLSEAYS